MGNLWEKAKLGRICSRISRGSSVKITEEICKESVVPFVRSHNIGDGIFIYEGLSFIEYSAAERIKSVKLEKGDILINMRLSSSLRFTLVPEDIIGGMVNQHVSVIRVKKNIIDPIFLKYFLMWDKTQNLLISMVMKGSVRTTLTKKAIENLEIYIPPMDQQKKIAFILSSLDNKIKLNNQMNKVINEMANAIFQYCFVDFIPFSQDEFRKSELGNIPGCWRIEKMKDIVPVTDGTHESPKKEEAGYKLITSRNIKNNSIEFKNVNFISKEDFKRINIRSRVEKLDILITMIGSIGNTLLVQDECIDYTIKNVGLIKTSSNKEMAEFIFMYLSSDRMKNYIKTRITGNSQKYISLTELRNIPVIVPPGNVIIKFNRLISKLYKKMAQNNFINSNLTNIRDISLSKLVSGKILLEDIT
ncbi:restriction endonuclease subunit S [Clostridium sp. WLY-B-L2]|uniref:Restriction endonuclease subunit S n=1 Tax=Clostridium aromativorans TaxID=2836848 RepID=A0ABS8N451_9CLOT|nr:restriction endonuclease subunit S [Clostridium aromativorans]MCC9293583.1 restriction endonuclease subunit S [Clostridium aromativorans]